MFSITVIDLKGEKTVLKTDKSPFTFGRSNKCDVVYPDETISRVHARFYFENSSFYIMDLGSANKTIVDGKTIAPNTKVPFQSWMLLNLGTLILQVEEIEEVQEPAPTPSPPRLLKDTAQAQGFTQSTVVKNINELERDRRVLQEHAKKRPLNKKSNDTKNKFVIYASVLGFIALAAYYVDQKQATNTEVIVQEEGVKDQFSSTESYKSYLLAANCAGHETVCQELKIDKSASEGIKVVGKEAFVYINPKLRASGSEYKPFENNPKLEEFVMIDVLPKLKSILLSFYTKEIEQIHVVSVTSLGELDKVIRIHRSKFPDAQVDFYKITDSIHLAYAKKEINHATDLLGKVIFRKNL